MTIAPEVRSLRGQLITRLSTDADFDGRLKIVPMIALDGPRAELTWKAWPSAHTFGLEDKISPWWSASVKPRGVNASLLTINGSEIEIPASANQQHDFRLFIDASVTALIVNRRHAITTRIHRKPDGPLSVSFSDKHTALSMTSVKIWQLQPISSNRLTT